MAGLGDMNVSIGAQISELTAGLSKANRDLLKTGSAFQALGKDVLQASGYFVRVPGTLKTTSAELAGAAIAANKFDSSLGRLRPGANQAMNAMTNLNRVMQDAPFGFMGVANNLNPLLESFQRLKAETGTTGGALKALGASIMGAGGIGFALSAFQFVALGGIDVLKKFFASASEAKGLDEAKKKVEDYKNAVASIFSGAGKEASEVISLITVLKSEVETRQRKIEALKELQKINPEIFGQLKLEANAVTGLDAAYKAYIANAKVVIAAKIKQAQVEQVITQLLKLQGAEQTTLVKNIISGFKNMASNMAKNGVPGAMEGINNATRKTSKEVTFLENKLEDLTQQLLELSKGIDVPAPKKAKDVETIAEMLAKMRAELRYLEDKEIKFKTDESENKIRVLDNAIEELFKKFKQTGDSKYVIQLQAEITEIRVNQQLKKIKFENPIDAKPELPPVETDQEVNVKFVPGDYEEGFLRDQIIKRLKDAGITHTLDGLFIVPSLNLSEVKPTFVKFLADLEAWKTKVSDIMGEVASSFAQGIAAFAQGGKVGNVLAGVFQGLLNTIGDFLIQMGKGAVKAGILSNALKNIGKAPNLGIAAGLAAIVAGYAIKSFKVPGFATGGQVTHSGFGKVNGPGTGKSDSILARLSNGEYVIKADIVKKYGVGFFNKINSGSRISTINSRNTTISSSRALSSVVNQNKITNPANFSVLPAFAEGGLVTSAGGFSTEPSTRTPLPQITGGQHIDIEVHGDFKIKNDHLAVAVGRGNSTISRRG